MEGEEPEIHFPITNLELFGLEKTTAPNGSFRYDYIKLKIGNHDIIIKQVEGYDEIMTRLRKKPWCSAVTAEIILNENVGNPEAMVDFVFDLCSLMSFAEGQTIFPVCSFTPGKETRIRQRFSPRVENFKPAAPVVPSKYFKFFLEKTFSEYIKLKDNFGLPILFNYYVLMVNSDILEVSCLFGYILLECLSSHAQEYFRKTGEPIQGRMKKKNMKVLQRELGKYKIPRETLESIAEDVSYEHPTLPETIHKIMDHFKIAKEKDDQEIFDSRKEYIHKGISQRRGRDHTEFMLELRCFVIRVLLGILDYNGPISSRYHPMD
ncbi:MAG: hypothetical protein WBA22_19440 [Candidatus Methanofastidiosia archaeon]